MTEILESYGYTPTEICTYLLQENHFINCSREDSYVRTLIEGTDSAGLYDYGLFS
jgi:hypothetical protein